MLHSSYASATKGSRNVTLSMFLVLVDPPGACYFWLHSYSRVPAGLGSYPEKSLSKPSAFDASGRAARVTARTPANQGRVEPRCRQRSTSGPVPLLFVNTPNGQRSLHCLNYSLLLMPRRWLAGVRAELRTNVAVAQTKHGSDTWVRSTHGWRQEEAGIAVVGHDHGLEPVGVVWAAERGCRREDQAG